MLIPLKIIFSFIFLNEVSLYPILQSLHLASVLDWRMKLIDLKLLLFQTSELVTSSEALLESYLTPWGRATMKTEKSENLREGSLFSFGGENVFLSTRKQ